MTTTAEAPSVDSKAEDLKKVLFESLRLLAHQYKLGLAWFKRQAMIEISPSIDQIKIENYKPDSPVLTMKYCTDKIYYILSKMLTETTSTPLFEGLRAYTRVFTIRRMKNELGNVCLYRIQDMPRPLARLFAYYVAMTYVLKSKRFNAALLFSDHNSFASNKNTESVYTGKLAKLFRYPFRILGYNTASVNHSFTGSSDTTSVNKTWITNWLNLNQCILTPEAYRSTIKYGNLSTLTEMLSKDASSKSLNGYLDNPSIGTPMYRGAYACGLLRFFNAIETESTVLPYKIFGPTQDLFEQNMNGLIFNPIIDSILSSGAQISNGMGSYMGYSNSLGVGIAQLAAYAMGPTSVRPSVQTPTHMFDDVRYSPGNVPLNKLIWNKANIKPHIPGPIFASIGTAHIYRGVSHAPALKSVCSSHKTAVQYFTSNEWISNGTATHFAMQNISSMFLNPSQSVWGPGKFHGDITCNTPSSYSGSATTKMSYIATSDVDDVLKKWDAEGIGIHEVNFMTPASLFRRIIDSAHPDEIFGFKINEAPTDEDVNRITAWIEKNCRFVTSIHSPILSSMVRTMEYINSMTGNEASPNKEFTSLQVLGAISMLEKVFASSYDGQMCPSFRQTPGGFTDSLVDTRIHNASMECFHAIRSLNEVLSHHVLATDIMSSKLKNVRSFMEHEAGRLLDEYVAMLRLGGKSFWGFEKGLENKADNPNFPMNRAIPTKKITKTDGTNWLVTEEAYNWI